MARDASCYILAIPRICKNQGVPSFAVLVTFIQVCVSSHLRFVVQVKKRRRCVAGFYKLSKVNHERLSQHFARDVNCGTRCSHVGAEQFSRTSANNSFMKLHVANTCTINAVELGPRWGENTVNQHGYNRGCGWRTSCSVTGHV